MAADVGRDVMGPELLLDQFHRSEDRALRAADAEARRARRHRLGERLDLLVRENWRRVRDRRLIAQKLGRMGNKKTAHARDHDRRGVFAAHRQDVLAGDPRLDVAAAQQRVQRLLEIVGRSLFDHQHR